MSYFLPGYQYWAITLGNGSKESYDRHGYVSQQSECFKQQLEVAHRGKVYKWLWPVHQPRKTSGLTIPIVNKRKGIVFSTDKYLNKDNDDLRTDRSLTESTMAIIECGECPDSDTSCKDDSGLAQNLTSSLSVSPGDCSDFNLFPYRDVIPLTLVL